MSTMWGMVRRSISPGDAGYPLLQRSRTRSSQPAPLRVATALSISGSVAIPVERRTGRQVEATCSSSPVSTSSKEATLRARTPRPTRSSTAPLSNGAERGSRPSDRASSKSGACHSHGVWASA